MRLPAESAGVGRKCALDREGDVIAGVWPGVERFKLQAHDAVAADRFGSAVSYSVRRRGSMPQPLCTFVTSKRVSYPSPDSFETLRTRTGKHTQSWPRLWPKQINEDVDYCRLRKG